MKPTVYILTNSNNTTLYTGVTSNLDERLNLHVNNTVCTFSSRYHTHKLVYVERHSTMMSAITREKQIKSWSRKRKIALIESINPRWMDLRMSNDI
ncbi:MAG: GIY-YIG nuclease family protein [Alistipes sp.]|nr:GIY-YIG nuclease family protein [Alistipes sp.]